MQVNDVLLPQKVTPGLPLDNAGLQDPLHLAQGPVLAVSKGPDIKLILFPRDLFCSGPGFLSFSP